MAGDGSCKCCDDDWDGHDRYMSCSKPFHGFHGPWYQSYWGSGWVPTVDGGMCGTKYLQRDTKIVETWRILQDGAWTTTIVTSTVKETVNRWTGVPTSESSFPYPGGFPTPYEVHEVSRQLIVNSAVLFSATMHLENAAGLATCDVALTCTCSDPYTFAMFREDMQAMYAQLKFATMKALKKSNPHWAFRHYGYTGSGAIAWMDVYAAADYSFPGYALFHGTDTDAHYWPGSGIDGLKGWFGGGYACGLLGLAYGDQYIYGLGAISIRDVPTNAYFCLWRGTYSSECPTDTISSETKTPFFTGNQEAVELGVEGKMPGPFLEALLKKDCAHAAYPDDEVWNY